jgi:uridine kinase
MNLVPVSKRLVEISLYNVAALSPGPLVEAGEREYAERLERAARCIVDSGARIIMLTGPSASGKTTSAHKLAATLAADGTPAHVVSLDNFFIGAENYPLLPDGTKDYESPATLDMEEINRCLSALSKEGRADLPVYDFVHERRAPERQPLDLAGGVCIVEGIHALDPDLTRILPKGGVYRIYAGLREEYSEDGRRTINTRDIRLCRRLLRDVADRGHSPEKTLSMWGRVLDGENKYIKIYKNTANLALDTSFSYELGVIAGLMPQVLAAVPENCLHHALLQEVTEHLAAVTPMAPACVPKTSMLQEFYGAL